MKIPNQKMMLPSVFFPRSHLVLLSLTSYGQRVSAWPKSKKKQNTEQYVPAVETFAVRAGIP